MSSADSESYSVNSNYGTADDLKALASALHDRGMYLMLDVVVNHMVRWVQPSEVLRAD